MEEERVPLKKVVMILAGLAAVLLLTLAGFMLASCGPAEPPTEADQPEQEPTPPPEPIYHPLTGVQISEEPTGRMFCVSVDNSPEARPQSGVGKASLVYELPAEGNIPRLLLCFYGVNADKIGPVRSARPYIVNTARGWDAMFAHCGWSPQAQQLLNSGVVDFVNEIAHSDYFWRDHDRSAPHNLYTSTELLNQALTEQNFPLSQSVAAFSFRRDGAALNGGVAVEQLSVSFDGAPTDYVYDPVRLAYGRYVSDNPYIDAETGNQIFATNVIIQYVDARLISGDTEGRLEVDLVGSGEALLFSGGKMLRGTWSRASLDATTDFRDESGAVFTLTPGQTWIELCDDNTKVSWEELTQQEGSVQE